MIDEVFNEIKSEARNSEIKLMDDSVFVPVRIGFNIVEDFESKNIPNFYIKDKEKFHKLLNEYVVKALEFYDLKFNRDSVKKILTYVFVNITDKEMQDLEKYIDKYIDFITDTLLKDRNGFINTSLGFLKFNISKQSFKQETPYCFKAYFEDKSSKSRYALPRISFGISNDICYIYAIQNKDSKVNSNPEYNLKIKSAFRSINSGIKKYRNVTPSFIIVLSVFISFLKKFDISKIKVESPLPIRHLNRKLVTDYKIRFITKSYLLKDETLQTFKKELEDKRILNDYNSTVKFIDCFNRLKIHFDNIFLSKCELDDGLILEVMNLNTKNGLLKEVTNIENNYEWRDDNGKISKYSSF